MMNERKFNALKWSILAFPAIWGAVALWLWHKVAGCSSPLSSYCWDVYEDGLVRFFSLSWVWDFQTLLAGIFALASAGAVIWQAKSNRDAEDRKQKASAVVACTIVSTEFRDEIKKLQERSKTTTNVKQQTKIPFPQSYMYLPTLCAISPQLGPIVAARIRDVVDTLDSPDDKDIDKEIACSEAIFHMLDEIPKRLTDDGRYNMDDPIKLRSRHLRSTLEGSCWSLDHMIAYRYFFDDGRAE